MPPFHLCCHFVLCEKSQEVLHKPLPLGGMYDSFGWSEAIVRQNVSIWQNIEFD